MSLRVREVKRGLLPLLFIVNIVLNSCAKSNIDNGVEVTDDINFNFATEFSEGATTKGGVITTSNLNSLGVFTYTTTTMSGTERKQKMFNAKYERKNSFENIFKPIEDGENDFIWDEDYHQFYAYAPHNATGVQFVDAADVSQTATAASNKLPGVKFTQASSDPDDHIDLLYGEELNILNDHYRAVGMELKHALSKISFSVKNVNVVPENTTGGDISINVTGITLSNVSQSAVLRYQSTTPWGDYSNKIVDAYNLTPTADVVIDNNSTEFLYGYNITGTSTDVGVSGGSLFCIPQKLDNATITIHYSYEANGLVSNKQSTIAIPADSEWLTGEAYHYIVNVNPYSNNVTITAQQVDWGSSNDIFSEVTYSYLYIEKSLYSLSYRVEGEEVGLDINFSASGTTDDLSIIYENTAGSTRTAEFIDGDPSKIRVKDTFNGVGETVCAEYVLDKSAQKILCTFYPRARSISSPQYVSDKITIKSGIVSTSISVVFYPTTTIDYTNIDVVNNELGQSSSDLIVSNCYITNSMSTDIVEYKIPIKKPINRFHPDVNLTTIDTDGNIIPSDEWSVEVFAFDNVLTINRVVFTKGVEVYGAGTTSRRVEPYFMMTLPYGYHNPGNIIVAIKNNSGKILWTWHMWITDYNPNDIIKNGTVYSSNPISPLPAWINPLATHYEHTKYDASNLNNRVHRFYEVNGTTVTEDYSYHMDRNIGSSSASYEGQGSLGGRGWLVYQFGRLAPIFGHQARFADGSNYITTRDESVRSRIDAVSEPSVVYFNNTETNWCSESIVIGKVWNDETISNSYEKSIFDPSPLGWMIPPMSEYWVSSGWDAYYNSSTNVQAYVSSSGNSYFSTNVINAQTGVASIVLFDYSHIWTNTDIAPSTSNGGKNWAAGVRFSNYTTNNKLQVNVGGDAFTRRDETTPHTLGAPIRPIFQFEQTGSV